MADMYLAVQTSLKRNVALKVLKTELARDDSYIERFRREAQAAAAIVHANIVQIFEVNQADGYHFIAQEYVRGRNLKQFLNRYGAVEPAMALAILRQCAMAIQKAEKFKIVHRDIKPENVMLTGNGEAKITDFGLARLQSDPSVKTLTQIGITMGTPLYMSPEQVEGGALDVRSDIYSLGVTIYHMLAGEPPFDGDSPLSIAVKQVKNIAKPLSEVRPDVPPDLADVVTQMMAKNKEDRPQNSVELLQLLAPIEIAHAGRDDHFFEGKLLADNQPRTPQVTRNSGSEAAVGSVKSIPLKFRRPSLRWMFPVATALLCLGGWWGGSYLAARMDDAMVTDFVNRRDPGVPVEDSIEAQYIAGYWAMSDVEPLDYETKIAQWQAVLDNFPLDQADASERNKTELFRRRALCRLGEIYLEARDLDHAQDIYDELANRQDLSQTFRVTGLAGQALTYSYRSPEFFTGGQLEQESLIRRCLIQLTDHLDLLNDFIRPKIEQLLEKYPLYSRSRAGFGGDFAAK